MVKSTCQNCQKRYVGCHDKCEEYKQYKSLHDEEREKERVFSVKNDRRKIYVNRVEYKSGNSPLKSHKK